MRERVGGQLGRRSSRPHDDVVGGGQAVRHVLVRKVGQLDDFGVELRLHVAQPPVELFGCFFQRGRACLGRFGFVLFALLEKHAYFFRYGVLFGQIAVQPRLNRLAFVVQLLDSVDGLGGVYALDGQTLDRVGPVFPDLLYRQHYSLKFYRVVSFSRLFARTHCFDNLSVV